MTIRVQLPFHLRTLANVGHEITLDVPAPITQHTLLDTLEAAHPALVGTIREHGTLKRRALVRFFGCREDLSHDPPDKPLPEPIVDGREPFIILGAIAGG